MGDERTSPQGTPVQSPKRITSRRTADGFHKVLEGINGGGDPWHTDGKLYGGVITTKMPR